MDGMCGNEWVHCGNGLGEGGRGISLGGVVVYISSCDRFVFWRLISKVWVLIPYPSSSISYIHAFFWKASLPEQARYFFCLSIKPSNPPHKSKCSIFRPLHSSPFPPESPTQHPSWASPPPMRKPSRVRHHFWHP